MLACAWIVDGFLFMSHMSEENDVMNSLQTKRAIFFMKTPFQLNCKLNCILMPLKVNLTFAIVREKQINVLKNFTLCFDVKKKN